MKHYLYPDACADSAYDIPYQKMYDLGYRGIIYDIDNTLVPHGAPADTRAIELFAELHRIGFCTVLISNNKEPRVKSFHEQVVFTQYIYKAGKPSGKNYRKAMEMMHTTTENTFFVGDQIFTDILGAKKAQIPSFLVRQIDKKEEIQIILKRRLEWIVLFFYRKYMKKHGQKWPDLQEANHAQ